MMSSQALETTTTPEEAPPVTRMEQTAPVKPQVTPPEQNTPQDPKVTPGETTKSTENEQISEEVKPEMNAIEQVLEKIVKNIEEPVKESLNEGTQNFDNTDTVENISETKNPDQEAKSVDDNKNKTVEEDSATTKTIQENEKPNLESEKPTANGEVQMVNGEDVKQAENVSQDTEENNDVDSSDCVNIQELTEHVMNILNDGVVEDVVTEQQLLRKNVDLQQFIVKLIHLLKEKTDLCANLDRQNSALISQAQSLKDVISITKDLLGIRNMEIEHLHADLTAMEETIKEERTRYNLSVQRLNEAMSLNDKLKTEYLTQMDLFQKLREKYTEKVVFLTRENQRLNGLMDTNKQSAELNHDETNTSDIESSQTESVDK